MNPKRTRRLRARAAAMSSVHEGEFEDYGSEPNMKLSHAFLVVLLLHVVAVGGLYLFNSMKAGKTPRAAIARSSSAPSGGTGGGGSTQGDSRGGGEGKGGPPAGDQAPVVAKASTRPDASQNDMPRQDPSSGRPGNTPSFYSSFLKKAAMMGAGLSGGAVKASAQEPASPANAVGGEPSPAQNHPKTYTVASGDTITRIAASLGVSIPDLEQANSMAGNSVLRVGQVLKIPEQRPKQTEQAAVGQPAQGVDGTLPAASKRLVASPESQGTVVPRATLPDPSPAGHDTAGSSTPASGSTTEYTVVKGDSPYRIAKRFKITPAELMKANNIADPKKIQIGQKLLIPTAKKASR